jgi:solute carrier family 13 (sodium-dependent dicarboxylate transporter), member 2/3/5
VDAAASNSRPHRRVAGVIVVAFAALVAMLAMVQDWGVPARAGIVAATCIALWLGELAPVWAPTVLLWVATPLLLAPLSDAFVPTRVLGWSADPVLALFLGGFALAAAASRQGADRAVAALAIRLARGRAVHLVVLVALATAVLSMWISNVAAAALMLAALKPVVDSDESTTGTLRRPLLLAIALAADVGGIATPVGTGSNGIAMAALERIHPISFAQWMLLGLPLSFGLLAAALTLIILRLRPSGTISTSTLVPPPITDGTWRLAIVFCITVMLWLTQPVHGVRAWVVALGAVGALAITRLITWREVRAMDWSTLLLIAGGIALGALLQESGLVRAGAARVPLSDVSPFLRVLTLSLLSALLSAVMSNTATAALLVPLAMSLDSSPSTAVIVAVSTSLGVPFVISTPPNAMTVGTGLIRSRDLLIPGILLMLGGCLLVSLTGPFVLRTMGIP